MTTTDSRGDDVSMPEVSGVRLSETAQGTQGATAPDPERRRPAQRLLSIAMVGTRGVPAAYGGFETAVEEIGRRLVDRGHTVSVYARAAAEPVREHLGMRVIHLPALRQKQLETLSHTGLSALHLVTRRRPDAAFVFNAANAPFLGMLRARGVPTALHMDGLEWRRSKWGPIGQEYYRRAEQIGVRSADALIADAPGIADYYDDQFAVPTELIRYGAPILEDGPATALREFGLAPGRYHLVVARFEPENHVLEIVEGYRRSDATRPLVVVGGAPYSGEYTRAIEEAAGEDSRIRLLGPVYDQDQLDALYLHAFTYVHGHSVGGTNPSLLRAIGAGCSVIAYDVGFNREVVDDVGWFFRSAADLPEQLRRAESEPRETGRQGRRNRERARREFCWDQVTSAYEDLAARLARGESVHPIARRARRRRGTWDR